MKFIFFICTIFFLLSTSCTKSSSGKPVITIQSINTVIPYNGELDAYLKFTDSKGGLSGGSFTTIIKNLNQAPISPGDSLTDSITSIIPNFPNTHTGQLEFTLPANSFHEHATQNDTVQLKFFATDAAGVGSDTVLSPVIVVLYQ